MPHNTLTINNTLLSNASNASLSTVPGTSLTGAEELLRGLTGWENTAEKVRTQEVLTRKQRLSLQEAHKQFQATPNIINRLHYAESLNNALNKAKTHQRYCLDQQQNHQALLEEEQEKDIKSPSYFTKFSKLVVNGMRYLVSEERAIRIEDFLLKSDHLERIEAYQKEALRQQAFIDSLEKNLNHLSRAIEDKDAPNLLQEEAAQESAPLPGSVSQLPGRRLLSENDTVTVINPIPDQLIEPNVPYRYCLDGNEIFSGNSTALLKVGNKPAWLTTHALVTGKISSIVAMDVKVENNLAFVADLNGYLQIIDVTDPQNPNTLSSYQTFNGTLGVFPKDNNVFLASSESGIYILDITNAANPTFLSNYDTPGLARDIFVSNNFMFVADGNAGLHIFDINNPTMPILLGNYNTSDDAYDVFVEGNTAFVAAYTAGLDIIDVSTPTSPIWLGNYDTPGWAVDVVVRNNIAFVADQAFGLQIIDVNNPLNPTLFARYSTLSWIYGVTLQDNVAFLAHADLGLETVNISNPIDPVLLTRYNALGDTQNVATKNSTVFLASYASGLQTFSLDQICLAGTPVRSNVGTTALTVSNIDDYNSLNMAANDQFSLSISSIPERVDTSLKLKSTFPDNSVSLTLNANALFNEPDQQFLRLDTILDNTLQKPSWLNLQQKLTPLGLYNTPYVARGIFIDQNNAYIADNAGLQIANLNDLTKPTFLGSYRPGGYAYDVVVENHFAYLAYGDAGLHIVDVTNPTAPTWLSNYNTPGYAVKVILNNNMVFVADGPSGLQLIDIRDPANPLLLGNYDTPGEAHDIAVLDNTAIVADGPSGLHIIDISDPNNLRLLASRSTPGSAEGLYLKGTTLFVADGPSGLRIFSVNDPFNPVLLSAYTTLHHAYKLVVQSHTAFIATFRDLTVIDVKKPTNPTLLGNYMLDYQAYDIALQGNTIFAANFVTDLQILSLSNWQLTISPNASHVGNHVVRVTVTDELGAQASDTFPLRVEGPPQFTAQIPPQYAKVDEVFNYFIPEGLVVDPNFDTPSFSATAQGQNVLLPWLSFNGISATFAGTPGAGHVGLHNISVVVTDNIPGTPVITQNFALFVSHKPTLANSILDQKIDLGTNATFSLLPSAGTQDEPYFTHLDGLPLTYSLLTEVALPTWLSFGANPPVFFIDARGMTSSASYRATLIVNDNQQGSIRTSFDFVVDYFPPVLKQPISNQVAAVGSQYSFAVSLDTFYDPNNPVLYYDARQSNGESLPGWLHFDPNSLLFSGEPGPGDTNTYADRILNLRVSATDQSSTAYADFELRVNGSSWIESFIYVAAPTVSTFGTLFGLYKKRSLLLNRCNKDKYQKLTQTVNSGEMFVYPLETERKSVHKLQAKRRRPLSACMRLFRSPRMKLEGELRLPEWMQYNRSLNRLESKELVPNNIPTENLTIQIKGSGNVILEQFELNIQGAEFKEDTAALPDQQDGDIELAEMRKVSRS